jgi:hypothetical protein
MENMLVRMAGKYVLDRLGEASTWAAITAGLAGSLHVDFNGDFKSAFMAFGLAGAALLGVMIKEGWSK